MLLVDPEPPPVVVPLTAGGTKINHNNVNYHVFTGTGPFSAPGDFNTSVNYIILGGGGGAGYSSPSGNGGPGGGGAGALIDKSSVSLSGPFSLTVTIGGAGAKGGLLTHLEAMVVIPVLTSQEEL